MLMNAWVNTSQRSFNLLSCTRAIIKNAIQPFTTYHCIHYNQFTVTKKNEWWITQ